MLEKFRVEFSVFLGQPRAPGWPETDSPRKMMQNSRIETEIRGLGTRFAAVQSFDKKRVRTNLQTYGLQNHGLAISDTPPPRKRKTKEINSNSAHSNFRNAPMGHGGNGARPEIAGQWSGKSKKTPAESGTIGESRLKPENHRKVTTEVAGKIKKTQRNPRKSGN